jgi:hypothetical protein
MPEAVSGIIALYGDSPRIRLLEYLMEFQNHQFTPSEIVEAVGMSRTTAFKELKNLLAENMIFPSKPIGKSPTYQINMNSPIVKVMQSIVSFRSQKIADSQTKAGNISEILAQRTSRNPKTLEMRRKVLASELNMTKDLLKEINA